MRLRALSLHGFKSFASPTRIEFEPGITAVVGPNGSGKSNVADAFRWVLGEQNLRSLRGKRTEDLVFAGGAARAPSGMAEVSLQLDDLDPQLELPFSELAILRRAYRSGENEFALNRERARLRDVLDLVGRLGLGADGFAIIGQGAVDAALSLRPEDRRTLLEHAASVGHLHARLDEAVDRLAQTDQNVVRVADLLSEITPRLHALERQAAQVREHDALRAELESSLARWFAHLLAEPLATRASAQARREQAERERALLAERERALDRRIGEERVAVDGTERALTEAREQEATARARRASLESALTHARERQVELARWRLELERRRVASKADLSVAEAALHSAGEEQERLTARQVALERNLAAEDEAARGAERQREALQRSLARAREAAERAGAEVLTGESRARAIEARALTIADEQRHAAAESAAGQAALVRLEDEARNAGAAVVEARRVGEEAARDAREADGALAQARERRAKVGAELADAERAWHAARGQVEALQSLETSAAGFYPGVRAVLQAANGHGSFHLDGIVGVVARLVQAAEDQELAIETALGSHLQDVVVERWQDAEAAIAELKRRSAGRATFLPLDTLRPPRMPVPPRGAGILGVATELVEVESRFRSVADFLLGHTLIVTDLRVARTVLPSCPPSFQIVTLEGELARPSGAVTGGSSGGSRGGSLGRTRELRAAGRILAARSAKREERAAELATAQDALDRAQSGADAANQRRRHADELVRKAAARVGDVERDLQRARREADRAERERQRLDDAAAEVRASIVEHARALARARESAGAADTAFAQARDALASFDSVAGTRLARVAAGRAERDETLRRQASVSAELKRALERRQVTTEEIAALAERDHQLQAAEDDLAGSLEALERDRAALDVGPADPVSALARLGAELNEARLRLKSREAERAALATASAAQSRRAQSAEAQVDRADAEIAALGRQVELELGTLDRVALALGTLRLAVDGREHALPIEPDPNADLSQARLQALRDRLRTLPVNREVLSEYDATRERHASVTARSDDLARAAATLRETIAETRRTMRARFDQTFEVVNSAFGRQFARMFGGGAARLELTGDEFEPGVDVIAQPPGKRSQSLATLSGGERALAATALLFALFEVNPPPFCVLDEVDAALDESNVGRFAATLRELGQSTQFVVITHNRRTMEAASAIYGLTLERRAESRVISLRLPV